MAGRVSADRDPECSAAQTGLPGLLNARARRRRRHAHWARRYTGEQKPNDREAGRAFRVRFAQLYVDTKSAGVTLPVVLAALCTEFADILRSWRFCSRVTPSHSPGSRFPRHAPPMIPRQPIALPHRQPSHRPVPLRQPLAERLRWSVLAHTSAAVDFGRTPRWPFFRLSSPGDTRGYFATTVASRSSFTWS